MIADPHPSHNRKLSDGIDTALPCLRGLLIHGARSVIYHIRRRLKASQSGGNPWVEQLLLRCHPNEVAVALTNKMALITRVLLVRNETWCPVRAVCSEAPG